MKEKRPNPEQEELIEQIDGIYITDAGPGTGKTFTISLRYAHLLKEKDVSPDDILLVTFTDNAAENMKERIINTSDHDKSELRDAPICTFHSYCNKLLTRYGHEAPKVIGIDDRITQSTRVMENDILERQEFSTFMSDFMEKYPGYNNFYCILHDKTELLDLIRSLGAKGIFPTKKGWFRNSEKYLDGDLEEFKRLFEKMNEPRPGTTKPRQSILREKLSGYKYKCFLSDAPSQDEIRGDGPHIPGRYAEICFEEDREDLKQFIHDVYFRYVEYALSRNYLNFSFMMMFAFALLCEDHSLRKEVQFDYMMIDEFQDTNEIQFKLALLLSKTGNICVVGDWKQSIFSFQYASVNNIKEFKKRLKEFREDLNTDHNRIGFPAKVEDEIKLRENFRSTQEIIDFSENALLVKATNDEILDKESIKSNITRLKSVDNQGPTEISSYVGKNEKEVILSKITEIVDNEDYDLLEKNVPRRIKYNDIAVLVRTRKFGLELLNKAEEKNVPVAYEGGIELFRRPQSILLLAWLRIVQNPHSKRGWSVVLDEVGYNIDEIKKMFDEKDFPQEMCEFRDSLEKEKTIGSLARKVFHKYSINDAFADKIIEVLQATYDNTYLNRENLIDFIVDNIRSKETYEVDSTTEDDVFKIQTIHSAKGLEYPVVILADMGKGGGGFGSSIEFTEPIGLRQSKIFTQEEYSYSYDNWKKFVISKCLTGDHDEERRLLYVAMTRAENYLFLTSEKDIESTFFNELAREPKLMEPKIEPSLPVSENREELVVEPSAKKAPVKYSAHSVVDVSHDEEKEGLGPEYGKKVHKFAEMYVAGNDIEPRNRDEENLKRYIDGVSGELVTEEVCLLPVETGTRKLLFKGVIDLLVIDGNTIKIVDHKTDRDRSNEEEYFRQVSIYYHAVKDAFLDKEVEPVLFYTENGEEVPVEVVELEKLVRDIHRKYSKKPCF